MNNDANKITSGEDNVGPGRYRSGFVAICGQPNVGKSTVLNGLLGEKVAITSARPETTRDNIRGILTGTGFQAVFVDTPGMHKPHDLLGKLMMSRAQSTLLDSDIILFLTEKRFAFNDGDMNIMDKLPAPGDDRKVFLIINKADRVKDKRMLLPLIKKASEKYPFDEIIPISALNEKHIDHLRKVILEHLPEGSRLYPEDQLSDRTEEFAIQEIVREKILNVTYEEVPHSVAVIVDEMEEDEELLKVHATIYVERTSQKSILIGKSGGMMKTIGELARKDIEEVFGKKVYINLWVKVFQKWKKDPKGLRELGYTD